MDPDIIIKTPVDAALLSTLLIAIGDAVSRHDKEAVMVAAPGEGTMGIEFREKARTLPSPMRGDRR